MIQLPNGCYCGELTVTPKNWKQIGASVKNPWCISYRFYDPEFKDLYRKGMLRIVKGMNDEKSLEARRQSTKENIEIELGVLQRGFNPIRAKLKLPAIQSTKTFSEIDPTTPILQALQFALTKISIEEGTRGDMTSMLKYFTQATNELKLQFTEIGQLRRKHIRLILDQVKVIRVVFSNNRFNKYRTYLMILMEELMELEAIDGNPVKDIRKKKEVKRIRELLSPAQRNIVNAYLFDYYRDFWRFLHIFFHSGSRITEICRVKLKDVDIENQRCKYLVKKGGAWHEVYRPIKDVILPLWVEHIGKAQNPDDFVFSWGLEPGPKKLPASQITKRWLRLVKKNTELKITADFYSLKHLNTDETAALLDIKDAAAQNSHTSTVITMKHYAFGEKDRQNERLKKVDNKFA